MKSLIGFARSDHQKHFDTRVRLKITNVVEEIQGHQQNWRNHLERNEIRIRLPHLAFCYRLSGRRELGRPKRRWRDQNLGILSNRP
jgi:hypothetical protein